MKILERLRSSIFKSYRSSSVEYHAGGFFIRKTALYIIFDSNNSLIFLERKEGLHPYDNNYVKLFDNKNIIEKQNYFFFKNIDGNLISYKRNEVELRIMPSIFIESVNDEKITEILVDWGGDDTSIFCHVSDFGKV